MLQLRAILLIIFGISSWIAINGIFVATDDLLKLPEGIQITVYLSVIIQIANIFPLLYLWRYTQIIEDKQNNGTSHNHAITLERRMIFFILILGTVACLLLAAFWDFSVRNTSLPLFILTFFLGAVDCTSTVLYWPYVFRLPNSQNAITSLSIGENFSALIVGCLGLIQSANTDSKRFSTHTLFGLFGVLTFFSLVSYLILDRCFPLTLETLRSETRPLLDPSSSDKPHGTIEVVPTDSIDQICSDALHSPKSDISESDHIIPSDPNTHHLKRLWTLFECHWPLFCVVIWLNFLGNGISPGATPYAVCGYSSDLIVWVSSLGPVCAVGGAAFSFIFSFKRTQPLVLLTMISTFVFCYLVALAAVYPNPWGASASHSVNGAAVITSIIILLNTGLCAYIKTNAWLLLHDQIENITYARIGGVATQFGSLIGSGVLLLLNQFAFTHDSC